MIVLGAVDEVAELRLPAHEGVLAGHRVAVLEAHRELGQQGVVDPELGLGRARGGPAAPTTVGVVDQHGVALAERAAPRVLPPAKRMSVPSSSSEPNASASAVAQSTWPSSRTALSRVAICLASLGWMLKSSGQPLSVP